MRRPSQGKDVSTLLEILLDEIGRFSFTSGFHYVSTLLEILPLVSSVLVGF